MSWCRHPTKKEGRESTNMEEGHSKCQRTMRDEQTYAEWNQSFCSINVFLRNVGECDSGVVCPRSPNAGAEGSLWSVPPRGLAAPALDCIARHSFLFCLWRCLPAVALLVAVSLVDSAMYGRRGPSFSGLRR